MEADWSIALATDDPLVVVPWAASEEEGGARYMDLRADPALLDAIVEAQSNPTLREALLLLNGAESPWSTVKCDCWASQDEPCDPYEMDAEPGQTAFSTGSYIDLLARDRAFRQSFCRQELWLRRVTEQLRLLRSRASRIDLVLRPADIEGDPGFAASWFVEACGASAEAAKQQWSRAVTLSLPVILGSLETDAGERYNECTGE